MSEWGEVDDTDVSFFYMVEAWELNSIDTKLRAFIEAGSWFIEVFEFNNAKLMS